MYRKVFLSSSIVHEFTQSLDTALELVKTCLESQVVLLDGGGVQMEQLHYLIQLAHTVSP